MRQQEINRNIMLTGIVCNFLFSGYCSENDFLTKKKFIKYANYIISKKN